MWISHLYKHTFFCDLGPCPFGGFFGVCFGGCFGGRFGGCFGGRFGGCFGGAFDTWGLWIQNISSEGKCKTWTLHGLMDWTIGLDYWFYTCPSSDDHAVNTMQCIHNIYINIHLLCVYQPSAFASASLLAVADCDCSHLHTENKD